MKRYRTEDLVRWAALGACRLHSTGSMHGEIFVERVGYVHPVTRAMHPPLTDEQRAMLAANDAWLLSQRPPWASVERSWPDFSHESPATRARMLRLVRLQLARGYVRRLRVGVERLWRKPLVWVRGECVRLLRLLGHERLARRVQGVAVAVVQMELGL